MNDRRGRAHAALLLDEQVRRLRYETRAPSKERRVKRWEHEAFPDAVQERWTGRWEPCTSAARWQNIRSVYDRVRKVLGP